MPVTPSRCWGTLFPLGHFLTGVTPNLISPLNLRLPKLRPNRIHTVRLLAFFVLPLLTLVGCGGAGLQTNIDPPPPATAPSITLQPGSQTVKVGQAGSFSVGASGTAPLSYQWQKNGAPISGANFSAYTTPATTVADDGSQFSAVVTNSMGSVVSSAATLSVMVPASIASQPANQAVVVGQTATFAVIGAGTAPLSYQWQKNGTPIFGATSPSYATPATVISDNNAQFAVVVSNSVGSALSNTAVLAVTAAPLQSISVTPSVASISAGNTQLFTATGVFADQSTQSLTSNVNWNSSNPSVATVNSVGTARGASAGTTTITASVGGVTSPGVTLTVTPAVLVSIAVTPVAASIAAGTSQPYVATGTFSNQTTQNISSTVNWVSSTTSTATINAAGVATGVAAGTTTISAAQSA